MPRPTIASAVAIGVLRLCTPATAQNAPPLPSPARAELLAAPLIRMNFTQYVRSDMLQGVGVARLAWADRDAPTGKAMVWRTRTWYPVTFTNVVGGSTRWTYSAAVPIFAAAESWHDDDTVVDAFWGPSGHWNGFLQQYVMLLNHASDSDWRQEGIYVSFAPTLDDPRLARFFMSGASQHMIHFTR